jgi:glycosyltransferase involved in cell wall biosynthesis
MKINFTLWSTMMNGGVRAIFEIVNGLSKRGHEITVTALDGDHRWFPLEAEVNYVQPPKILKMFNPIIRKKYGRPMSYLITEPLVAKMGFKIDYIKHLSEAIPECDVNVATWYPTCFSVHRSNKGIPFYFFMDFEELARMAGPYHYRMFNESLHLPFNIITISSWLKDWIKENYGKDAAICGCGINHDVFYPRQNILSSIKRPKIMGMFAELEYKGNKDLIDALNILAGKTPEINVIAVSAKKRIFEKLINKNKVNFNYSFFERPTDDELAELYSSADIFVFSSHIEGFGLPPLEAMACGTPVVTTDCLGVRDYIKNGENAIMVPPKKPYELARGIKQLLNNQSLLELFKKNGLKTAQEFTWDIVTDKFEKVICDAIND